MVIPAGQTLNQIKTVDGRGSGLDADLLHGVDGSLYALKSELGGGGTVTSVDASGGTTGLTFSGGPITTSGTITMAGTLALANGGTGATTASGARTNLGLGTMATESSSSYALVAHTHTASQVTDFSEAVDDRVNALLVAGTNITLTYNDGANTLTIDSGSAGPTAFAVQAVGTGVSQAVTLPATGYTVESVIVAVNGIKYETSEYTIVGDQLTLTTNASGDSIEIVWTAATGGGGGGGGGWVPEVPVAANFTTLANSPSIGVPSITDAIWHPGVISAHPRQTSSTHHQNFVGTDNPSVSGSFRIEAKIACPQITTNNYPHNGLALYDSATGQNVQIMFYLGGTSDLRILTNLNPTLSTAAVTSITIDEGNMGANYMSNNSAFMWFAIEWNDTSGEVSMLWSADGYMWFRYGYYLTSDFTNYPDKIGFHHKSVSTATGTEYIHCNHFYHTTNLAEGIGLNRGL